MGEIQLPLVGRDRERAALLAAERDAIIRGRRHAERRALAQRR